MTVQITSGRTLRMLKVGTLTGQVGSSYLWQGLLRPFRSLDAHQKDLLETHVRNALRIVDSAKELRGTFMKFVQILSMRDDLFPAEALEVLSVVQSSVPPMDSRQIRECVRAEFGKPPEKIFRKFEREAFAAASLGQVHRAELFSGERVVVKIQYPGVEETVEQDLRNVEALLQIFSRIARDVMRQSIDTTEICRELEERLREELDYRLEAANLAVFGKLFADDEEIEIPEAHPELCTRRVLTMSLVEGYPIADILAPEIDRELKDWVAVKYFRTVWRQVLTFGLLHTDPHPGNYLVTGRPRLGILDFGSVRRFSEPVRRAYRRLARALLDWNEAELVGASHELGLHREGDSPGPLLEIFETLLEPLLVDRKYDPAEYHSIEKALSAAQVSLKNRLFRTSGHHVFLLRALVGLESYVKQLGTVANWRRIFAEEVDAAA